MGIVSVTTFSSDTETVTRAKLNGLAANLVTEFNGSIDDDNVKAAAGIAYSKLNLTGSIVDADIGGSAAIVATKLATIATAGKVSGAALTLLPNIPSAAGVVPVANLGSGTPTASTFLNGAGAWATGSIVQTAYAVLNTVQHITTALALDDSPPLWSEGTAVTNLSIAFTPLSTSNYLLIYVNLLCGLAQAGTQVIASLFKDGTGTDACLAASCCYPATVSTVQPLTLIYREQVSATAAQTWVVRAGCDGAYHININGVGAGTQVFGGVAVSTMTIMEIAA